MNIKRKPNYQIVLNALQDGEEKLTVELPNGMVIGWASGHLCQVLYVWKNGGVLDGAPHDEEKWVICDIPLNMFIKQCDQLDEGTIANLVFSSTMKKMRNSPTNPTKWE